LTTGANARSIATRGSVDDRSVNAVRIRRQIALIVRTLVSVITANTRFPLWSTSRDPLVRFDAQSFRAIATGAGATIAPVTKLLDSNPSGSIAGFAVRAYVTLNLIERAY
jgi:hypothetical protein